MPLGPALGRQRQADLEPGLSLATEPKEKWRREEGEREGWLGCSSVAEILLSTSGPIPNPKICAGLEAERKWGYPLAGGRASPPILCSLQKVSLELELEDEEVTLRVQWEEPGTPGGGHPQTLFSSTSKSICNPSIISGALLISAFNRSGPHCAGSRAPRPWGQTVVNESDILVTQAPEAWHPMEKACKWFPSLDPWGGQTNPTGSGIPGLPSFSLGWTSFHRPGFLPVPPPPTWAQRVFHPLSLLPASPSPAAGRDPAGSLWTGHAFTRTLQGAGRGVAWGEGLELCDKEEFPVPKRY